MSDANNEQLRPPPSWDKFEEICADLFSRIWGDPQVVRYGTRGQAQNDIDIYGKNDGTDSGVQCKGKRDWPPTKLTISEIDEEVEKAKAFSLKLRSFIIATTAENHARLTDRANAISAEHEKSHAIIHLDWYLYWLYDRWTYFRSLGWRHALLFGSVAQWCRRLCGTVARIASVKMTEATTTRLSVCPKSRGNDVLSFVGHIYQ
jgi:hypothetical protein